MTTREESPRSDTDQAAMAGPHDQTASGASTDTTAGTPAEGAQSQQQGVQDLPGAQGVQDQQTAQAAAERRAVEEAATVRLNRIDLHRIEDTGSIALKGITAAAPKITTSAISKEEREARRKAREAAQTKKTEPERPARTALGRWWHKLQSGPDRIKFSMCIVAMGVVYGDIGTSPLYTAQSFIQGQGGALSKVSEESVLGLLSLLFWSITLVTTVNHVLIAMRVDNKGEGGIFALYSLVRRYAHWLWIPAMVGGAAFLADSVLTPAVSISSAVEGLNTLPPLKAFFSQNASATMVITAIIIIILFLVQSRGTESIGKVFGSIVSVWFAFIAIMGIINLDGQWQVFRALDPVLGIKFLFSPGNKSGIFIMGTVFLSTTGAEALYSDMGHVGRGSIYATWPLINLSLVFCYFGQGAWMLKNKALPQYKTGLINPFFEMMPNDTWKTIAVILSVTAGIIASQALITGAFTMVSEATSLNWMPHLQVRYPASTRGQIYIPAINTVLCVSTLIVLFTFRTSDRMTNAYGLALTITMIMTVILLFNYIWYAWHQRFWAIVFLVVFLSIQILFFVSSLNKFMTGGWFTMILTLLILTVMYAWDKGTAVERSQRRHLSPDEFLPALDMLHRDATVPYFADNLVYLTSDSEMRRLDTDIFYSIFSNTPKRARAWWAVSVETTDDPFTREYSVESFGTPYMFRVRLRLGFKIRQSVAIYLHQIMHDLVDSGELPEQTTIYPKLDDDQQIGHITYVLIHKDLMPESKIDQSGATALRIKYALRRVCGNPAKWFGLAAYNPITETQPVFVATEPVAPLKRIALRKVKRPVTLEAVLQRQQEKAAKEAAKEAEKQARKAEREKEREERKAEKAEQKQEEKVEKAEKKHEEKVEKAEQKQEEKVEKAEARQAVKVSKAGKSAGRRQAGKGTGRKKAIRRK